MVNLNYIRGRRLEYKIINLLKEQGEYPIRSAGSHTFFDVISLGQGYFRLIQAKKRHVTASDKKAFEKDVLSFDAICHNDNALYYLVYEEKRKLMSLRYDIRVRNFYEETLF